MQENWIGFGIAGNFAHHLEQAGESADFVDIKVDDKDAPKGIFPTFVPNSKDFIGVYPFSNTKIIAPKDKDIQMEPEIALFCDLEYEDGKVANITPRHFCAYNDCSIRVEGAKKISHKKNWGESSKAYSNDLIEIDKFSKGGVMDRFSLASFIVRDGKVIEYGENSQVLGYSYFYEKLLDWIKDKLNTQEDIGPLENLQDHLKTAKNPSKMLISIGATRYTDFGEKNYLKKGDRLLVIAYDHTIYSYDEIWQMMKKGEFKKDGLSILDHEVC